MFMGDLVRSMKKISHGYETYLTLVRHAYNNTAERIISENFRNIAHDIGEKALISDFIDIQGTGEAERKFGIKWKDSRPILVITQVHPHEWKKEDGAIKIQMGRFNDENELRDFLRKLAILVCSEEFGMIKWELRKRRIREIGSKIPIVDLLGVAASLWNTKT